MIPELQDLSEEDILALTLIGEARGEPIEGIVGVASVIRNRVQLRYKGTSYSDICLAKSQFSCWLPGSNYDLLISIARKLKAKEEITDIFLNQCFLVASGIIYWKLRDNTKGATHYLTTALYHSPNCPTWAKSSKITTVLGSQIFLIAA